MQRRETLKTIAAGTISTGLLLDACGTNGKSSGELQTSGPLAARGVTASTAMIRVDMDLYFEATANLYHKINNPNGAFPLNVAENRLTWPLLRDRISKITKESVVDDWVAGYTSSVGAPSTRVVMAKFLSKFLTRCEIDPEHICLAPGAAAVIDLTSWILCEPGDVAVIPAPAYPVYKQDIGNRPAVERYNLITHHELAELKNGPLLSVAHLDQALADIESKGKRFRMLILTNPDNPTGVVYSRDQLRAYTDWCIAHNVHLVVNEIYGLSLLNTQHPELASDYSGPTEFQSFANIVQERKSDYLHLWYALSKDFGVSGFRVGIVYSLNQVFRAAYNNLNAPSMMSNYAQWIFEKILSDHEFVEAYVRANQEALTENYALTVSRLRKLGIPYSPARGSLFVWLDLSGLLKDDSADSERALWMSLYKESGILLTPGDGFGHSKRGQFRLVYSYMVKDDLSVAMDRFANFINAKRV